MSHTPHELAQDFPELAALMSDLKTRDAHFAKLAQDYNDLNEAVHRAETNLEPVEDLVEGDLRKKRAALKDEIYAYLKEQA